MQSNKGRNTRIEVELRSALHRTGLRFWKHRHVVPGLRCEADIVFPRMRLVVFVDGCFWHGCPVHATRPMLNGDWWAVKLDANRDRDRRNDRLLTEAGWRVLRLWEHESVGDMVRLVSDALAELRQRSGS